ncbi:hypothetical protein [Acidisoma silvae]|uniref:OmpA-like domain-containing protein n=1 Tax=Acidisoma silvae TaxID=2802396 RepID=A0A963YNW9_9PROT|nr:hypothetical protein [Acidisoma silvae]MCB8873939.1 hypothetical protein [Acidisoma silvae]
MRRTRPFLFATLVLAAPLPAAVQAAAQVTVDPNALNKLGSPSLPAPPPAQGASPATPSHRVWHRPRHHTASTGHKTHSAPEGTAAGTTPPLPATPPPAPAKPEAGAKPAVILPPAATKTENRANLGSSFEAVPVLPGAIPAMPAPPKITVETPAPKKPKPPKVAPSAASPAAPVPVPPPPSEAPPPADLSPATPAPVAAAPQPAAPPVTAPKPPVAPAAPAPAPIKTPASSQNSLPPGADLLTLPYTGQDTDASGAVPALIRDFVTRHGTSVLYVVRAYASQPKGDDDPSTPRRLALMRAQGVAAALQDAGVDPIHIRLLALGNSGGNAGNAPTERVDLIAMPPATGHSASPSSP